MATQFAMPVPATHGNTFATTNQYTLYGAQSQQTSPVNSVTATPSGGSPTSPRSQLSQIPQQSRQLRPMKSPLYMPAVLRPTEAPKRVLKPSGPTTPPASSNSSFESMNTTPVKPLDRRNTGDSGKFGLGKITEIETSTQGLGKVTGFPTKKHWKHDSASSICDAPTCTSSFTLFTRRHHCRRCGNIFCDTHSSNVVPLDQNADYHPGGTYARACDFCSNDYRGWAISRSRSNSEDSTVLQELISEPATPTIACGKKMPGGLKSVFGKGGVAESLGQSVPRDWNWSTF